jgi:hypothetical protein
VIFELSQLEFISSLAMGVLVAYRRAVVRAGGRVCLAADLQPGVREALDRAQLRSLFEDVGTAKPCATSIAGDGQKPHANGDDAQGTDGARRPSDLRMPPSGPITSDIENRQRTAHPHGGRPGAEPTGKRFHRLTIGFWLGGLALGTGGCLLGACTPYRHPVGVTVSILWWGIYLGCLGASIGAGIGGLFGRWWEQTPASPSHESDRGDEAPSPAALPCCVHCSAKRSTTFSRSL